ncbi:MAG TPA: HAD-IB family hydrolase [Phenylobacterium sp.]|uniref:HAD-IB family hydrolase n=1 Tax=Phenylobacterium sp. TaxID=1871053 RepID=UPI002B47A2CC|nr:HAD-IB family hydrolase [Phenylobacterium sp.]HKR89762.1 HAD-IB family hydrolase [Phenylobacterium sp.]
MAQDGVTRASCGETERRAPNAGRAIVAFDFDGTLTIRDSFTAFLRWRAGPIRHALGMARLAPAALRYLIDRDRGRIKAAAVREFLAGLTRDELRRAAESFAAEQSAAMFRPDALQTWRDWRDRGASMVIVTASPSDVVRPFAERLQAEALIGTELAFDAQDRLTGGFVTPNCRGPEKVARLEARFGAGVRLAAAYGDTGGDREMLAIAETAGFQVFTARP